MKDYPLVSIIVPSFNQAEYISITLDSLLNQTYPNLEIILIDGASTDNTLEVLKSYQNQLSHLISESDKGQSDAINKGFAIAKGDIVGWLNSDDILYHDSISKVVDCFKTYDNLSFVYGDIDLIDSNGTVIGELHGQAEIDKSIFWKLDINIPQQGSLWRRSRLNLVLKLNQGYNYVLDREIFLKTVLTSQIKYLPVVLGAFRYHDSSKSVSQIRGWISEIPLMYDNLVHAYKAKFSYIDIRKIKSMAYLYISIEYFKSRNKILLFKNIVKSLYIYPFVFFSSGLATKYLKWIYKRR